MRSVAERNAACVKGMRPKPTLKLQIRCRGCRRISAIGHGSALRTHAWVLLPVTKTLISLQLSAIAARASPPGTFHLKPCGAVGEPGGS